MRVCQLSIRSCLFLVSLSAAVIAGSLVMSRDSNADSNAAFSSQMKQFLETTEGRSLLVTAMKKAAEEEQEREKQEALESAFKTREDVALGTSPGKGNPQAKVTIVEFSDFECPYCSRGNQTIQQVLKAFPNDVKVSFKNLPLAFHEQAGPAAKAALAAAKQGKFWEFHDELFAKQDKLGQPLFEEIAKGLGLNVDQWRKDLDSADVAAAVKADEEQAKKLGIRGTPAFFVNGVRVAGAYPFEHFKSIVDRLLAEK